MGGDVGSQAVLLWVVMCATVITHLRVLYNLTTSFSFNSSFQHTLTDAHMRSLPQKGA